jgi:hypothetical protein
MINEDVVDIEPKFKFSTADYRCSIVRLTTRSPGLICSFVMRLFSSHVASERVDMHDVCVVALSLEGIW